MESFEGEDTMSEEYKCTICGKTFAQSIKDLGTKGEASEHMCKYLPKTSEETLVYCGCQNCGNWIDYCGGCGGEFERNDDIFCEDNRRHYCSGCKGSKE